MAIDLSKIQDTDLFAATAPNGVTYKVTGAQFKTLFGPPPPQTQWDIINVTTDTIDWGIYISVINHDTGAELTDSEFYYGATRRSTDLIFGPTRHPINDKALYATKVGSQVDAEVRFEPDIQITVNSSVTFVAGFHERSQNGTMYINDVAMLNFDAWDLFPSEFTVPFSGVIESFSIKQTNITPTGDANTAPAIGSISVDGNQLVNGDSNTTLHLSPTSDMTQFTVLGTVKQISPTVVTGRIAQVDAANYILKLDNNYPGFVTGGVLEIQ